MKGLQLAKHFYFDCVKQLITDHLPELKEKYAAGLIGYGSDVLGNDDEMSRDHEWGPRLLLFLDKELHSKYADKADKIFNEFLPPSFEGFSTRFKEAAECGTEMSTDTSGFHHITITTPERFLELTLGFDSVPETDLDWLLISEQRLLEFTRGEIFEDFTGELSRLREQFSYFPDDVWKYRMAFLLESLPWSSDLISLCGARGDHLSVQINLAKTVEKMMKLCFLLNKKYCPLYPKWLHREFKKLPELSTDVEPFLSNAFQQSDHALMIEQLNKAYDLIVGFMTEEDLCRVSSAESLRFRGFAKYDFPRAAREILGTIQGDLSNLTVDYVIDGIPAGAVDQWLIHEDMLMSAPHRAAAKGIYCAKAVKRDRIGDWV
jgi:hypothetical protein